MLLLRNVRCHRGTATETLWFGSAALSLSLSTAMTMTMVMLSRSVTAAVATTTVPLVVAGSGCFGDGDPSAGAITGSTRIELDLPNGEQYGEQHEHGDSCGVYSDYIFHVSYQCCCWNEWKYRAVLEFHNRTECPFGNSRLVRWIFVSFHFISSCCYIVCLQHGTLSLSELDYALAPTGMEATYPKETATQDYRPGVSILIEGTRVVYDALGLRIVVPSQHTLGGREFAAELQIVHGRRKHIGDKNAAAEGAPSFLVLGIWIDPKTTLNSNANATTERTGSSSSSQEAIGEVLVEWQTAMNSLGALCNGTSDGIAVAVAAEGTNTMEPEGPETVFSAQPEAPEAGVSAPVTVAVPSVVVGRGNEQNFENNPIRRRRRRLEESANHTPKTPYDWWDIEQQPGQNNSKIPFSFYAYEREVEVELAGACNETTVTTVLWNLAETPLEISDEQLATMRSLVMGYRDAIAIANCKPFPTSSSPFGGMDEHELAQTRNANAATRVCSSTNEKMLPNSKASSCYSPMVSPLLSGAVTVVAVVTVAATATLFL